MINFNDRIYKKVEENNTFQHKYTIGFRTSKFGVNYLNTFNYIRPRDVNLVQK